MNYRYFVLAVTIAACFLMPINSGFCETFDTHQGTEWLDEIHGIAQSAVQYITDQNDEKILACIKDMKQLWQGFTAHHEEIFSGEINPPEGMAGLFTGIANDLDILEQRRSAKDFDNAGQTVQNVIESVASLNEILTLPVLLDFTGPKCKSCKVMKARLTQVAPDYAGRVRIVLVDVNVQKNFTRKYKIMLIPTLVFIDKTGTETDRHVGQMEEPAIRAGLDDLVKKSDTNKR